MLSPSAWIAARVGLYRRGAPRAAAAPPAAPPAARVADLDGLRGLAILAVVAVHSTNALLGLVQQGYTVARVDAPLYLALHAGWAGVDLFFVLSGYLITGILLKAKGHPATTGTSTPAAPCGSCRCTTACSSPGWRWPAPRGRGGWP